MIIETVRQLLGNAIREHRKGKGWTQAELAERAGISTQTVSLIEGGHRWPEYDNLQRLAVALDLSEHALFAWAPAPSPTPQEALEVIARELNRAAKAQPAGDPLAEKLAKLAPSARAAIEAMVDGALLAEKPPQQDGKAPERGK